jgi:hypothetical protein
MCKKRRSLIFCLITILISIVTFFPSSFVLACDCVSPDNANEALEKASAVFKGEVMKLKEEKKDGENDNVALISVSEIWKGIDESQVKVYTDRNSSCHFDFELGKEYLLYPYEHNGKLKVMNCGRSTEIEYASKDLSELGKGKNPSHLVQLEDEFKNNRLLILISIVLTLIVIISIIVVLRKVKRNN